MLYCLAVISPAVLKCLANLPPLLLKLYQTYPLDNWQSSTLFTTIFYITRSLWIKSTKFLKIHCIYKEKTYNIFQTNELMSHLITKPTHVTQELLHATRDKYLRPGRPVEMGPTETGWSGWTGKQWKTVWTGRFNLNSGEELAQLNRIEPQFIEMNRFSIKILIKNVNCRVELVFFEIIKMFSHMR